MLVYGPFLFFFCNVCTSHFCEALENMETMRPLVVALKAKYETRIFSYVKALELSFVFLFKEWFTTHLDKK